MFNRLLWLLGLTFVAVIARADTNAFVSLLRAAANDADPDIRAQALRSIGNQEERAEYAVPEILAALDDRDPSVRYEAAVALGRVKPSSSAAVERLAKAVSDNSSAVREAAIGALTNLGTSAKAAEPVLLQVIKQRDQYGQEEALRALAAVAEHWSHELDPALPLLLPIAQDDRNEVLRTSALRCLEKTDPNDAQRKVVRRVLLDAVRSPSAQVRVAALDAMATALSSMEDGQALLKGQLHGLMRDPDADVRLALIRFTAIVGLDGSEESRDLLDQATKDPYAQVRLEAMTVLKSASDEYVEMVLPSLKDPSSQVRSATLDTLGIMGKDSPFICQEASHLVADRNEDVRASSVKILGSCKRGPESVIEALLKSSMDSSGMVRKQAMESVGTLAAAARDHGAAPAGFANSSLLRGRAGQMSSTSTAVVLTALKDPESAVRSAAADTLLQLAPFEDDAIEKIAAAADGEYVEVRVASLRALATFGRQAGSTTPMLIRRLQGAGGLSDEDAQIRGAAAETLGFVGGNQGTLLIPAFRKMLQEYGDTGANVRAIRALGRMGSDATAAIPELIFHLTEGAWEEKEAALITLGFLGQPALNAVDGAVARQHEVDIERANTRDKNRLMAIMTTSVPSDASDRLKDLQASGTVTLIGRDGQREEVTLNPKSVLIAVATWCPHSRALMEFLASEDIKRMTPGWNLNFVFDDEFPYLEKVLAEQVAEGKMTPSERAEKLEYLRARAGGLKVFDPDVLAHVPGRVLFVASDSPQVGSEGFPAFFSVAKSKFKSGGANHWSEEVLGIPEWRVSQVDW